MISKSYTINSANTWEYKTISIPADTAGVINNDNGYGFQISFWLNSGSDFTGGSHATTWSTYDATNRNASNLGLGGAVNDYFAITGVQLEVGSVATPFEHESYAETLAKCQRYYQRFNASGNFSRYGNGYWSNSNDANVSISFPVPMRADPSIDDTGDVTDYGISNAGSVYTPTSLPTFYRGTQTSDGSCLVSSLSLVSTGNGTAGNVAQFMSRGGGLAVGTFIGFDAEL